MADRKLTSPEYGAPQTAQDVLERYGVSKVEDIPAAGTRQLPPENAREAPPVSKTRQPHGMGNDGVIAPDPAKQLVDQDGNVLDFKTIGDLKDLPTGAKFVNVSHTPEPKSERGRRRRRREREKPKSGQADAPSRRNEDLGPHKEADLQPLVSSQALTEYVFNSIIRSIKNKPTTHASTIRTETHKALRRLGLRRNGRKAVKGTPAGSDDGNRMSIFEWCRKVGKDDNDAVSQLIAIDATAHQRVTG